MWSSLAKFSEYYSSALLDWGMSSEISSSHAFFGCCLPDLDLLWRIGSFGCYLTMAEPDLPLCFGFSLSGIS